MAQNIITPQQGIITPQVVDIRERVAQDTVGGFLDGLGAINQLMQGGAERATLMAGVTAIRIGEVEVNHLNGGAKNLDGSAAAVLLENHAHEVAQEGQALVPKRVSNKQAVIKPPVKRVTKKDPPEESSKTPQVG